MALNTGFLGELKHEAVNTRKMLERVPTDKLSWKPHEKSMTLGRLASHLAELPFWMRATIENAELDFAKYPRIPFKGETTEQIVNEYNKRIEEATKILEIATDEQLNAIWTMRNGEKIFFQLPRKIVLRNFVFNHQVHHRGQLSVYLRLLNVPVPGMYGPSADEKESQES